MTRNESRVIKDAKDLDPWPRMPRISRIKHIKSRLNTALQELPYLTLLTRPYPNFPKKWQDGMNFC